MGTEMSAQVSRKQPVVILVPIPSVLACRAVVLSCIQLKSEGEYMGLEGRVPIPGGGNPTASI